MSDPQIRPRWHSVPASSVMQAIGDALERIKFEDGLTDADLGAELGKSEDQAARYRAGLAEMPATVLHRALTRWDGRFGAEFMALAGGKFVPLEPADANDRELPTRLTRLLLELSVALEDGSLSESELRAMRRAVEEAGQAVDQLRERLKVRAA
jgi:hypothetical protein